MGVGDSHMRVLLCKQRSADQLSMALYRSLRAGNGQSEAQQLSWHLARALFKSHCLSFNLELRCTFTQGEQPNQYMRPVRQGEGQA